VTALCPHAASHVEEKRMKTREELMALSRRFWESRALLTAVELRVFETLGGRRLGVKALAQRVGADSRALGLLLDALTGQGLLRKQGNSYAITAAMRPFLTEGPDSLLSMLRHHVVLWRTWSSLTDCVRSGRPAQEKEGFRQGSEEARLFTMAMRDGARRFAPAVVGEVNLKGRRLLLDLGGGPGVFAAWFARKYPGLRIVVVDLPNVARVGEELVAEFPDVQDRITYYAADLLKDPLPQGADAAFISHVIHSNTEEGTQIMLERIATALEPGGLLVVRDFFLSPEGTRPAFASLFSLNMLVNTPGGRSYTAKEVTGWLRQAGFQSVSFRRSKGVPDSGYLFARLPK
jgi:predicted O-methyltransferase YrrM